MGKRDDTEFLTAYFDDINAVTRHDLVGLLTSYRPVGSGPLGVQRLLCRLLVQIASLKGFVAITIDDIETTQRARALAKEEDDWLKRSVADLVGYSRISAESARDRMSQTADRAPTSYIRHEFIKIAEAIIEQITTDTPGPG